jgi:N-acetylglucosamine kinase-like BadF-type ATPase
MSPAVLLGVDGGGTSTLAWLADEGGKVLGRGRAGPSNAKAPGVGQEGARAALSESIALAFTDAGLPPAPVRVACLGLAGFDRPDDRRLLEDWSGRSSWAERLIVVNDGDLVIAAGTPDGWGLGVIAGTGSIAVGRNPRGRTARAGGWGPLIGDEGSAYVVALAALRLVARRADGREAVEGPRDPLTERLCAELALGGPGEIVTAIYSERYDRARIAALAPAVLEAARDEPDLVARLLEPAGRELAEMVMSVARELGLSPGVVPLALGGSFLLAAAEISRTLIAALRRAGVEPETTRVGEPVRGALVLAGRALDVGGDER